MSSMYSSMYVCLFVYLNIYLNIVSIVPEEVRCVMFSKLFEMRIAVVTIAKTTTATKQQQFNAIKTIVCTK